jgi:hypothetical protein
MALCIAGLSIIPMALCIAGLSIIPMALCIAALFVESLIARIDEMSIISDTFIRESICGE